MKWSHIKIIAREFVAFSRNTRANVALIFGIAAFPLLGLVSAAVDFGLAATTKAQLDAALDSAALLATTSASRAIAAGMTVNTAITDAQNLAASRFSAQVSALSSATITGVTATITATGGTLNAVVNYTADYPTSVSEILGFGTIPLFGQTSTTLTISPYANINILVDTSMSMGIGSTQADMDAMGNLFTAYLANPPVPIASLPSDITVNTGSSCALACHWTNSYADLYTVAESNGITLRIDVVRNAVSNAITQLSGMNSNNYLQLALYGFTNSVNTIFPLSNNISSATSALSQIAPGFANMTGAQPLAETDFPDSVTSITNTIGTSGNGTSRSTARQYLIIVTDGVQDYYLNGNRTMGAIDPTVCNQAKANGVTVMVLYTPYIPLVTPYVVSSDGTYVSNIQPVAGNIFPDLQGCASQPAYAIQASDSASINAAMQQLIAIATTAPSHLTQ